MIVFRKLEESLTIQRLAVPELRGGVLITRSAFVPDARRLGARGGSATVRRRFEQAIADYGLRIGLRVARGQSASLSMSGMEVGEDGEVTRELQRTFAAPGGERWVGFVAKRASTRRTGKRQATRQPTTTLKLRGYRNPTAHAFQLMPVVVALGNQAFSNHHLLGVSVLYAQRRLVQTRVDSRFLGKAR